MSIRISLPIIEQTYELLRETAPFKRWRLPPADDISFSITRDRGSRGEFYLVDGKTPTIGVNDMSHHTLDELLRTVAHEMCHLRLHLLGARKDVHHGRAFKRLAHLVCHHHQFDLGAF